MFRFFRLFRRPGPQMLPRLLALMNDFYSSSGLRLIIRMSDHPVETKIIRLVVFRKLEFERKRILRDDFQGFLWYKRLEHSGIERAFVTGRRDHDRFNVVEFLTEQPHHHVLTRFDNCLTILPEKRASVIMQPHVPLILQYAT